LSVVEYGSAPTGPLERDSTLNLWVKRALAARKHRRRFEKNWMEAQLFAAGQQWVEYNTRTHRTLVPDPSDSSGRKRTHDVLMQFVWTVLGAMATDDFRPRMVAGPQEGVDARDAAAYVDKALGFAWDREIDGDACIHDLLLDLVIYGTAAMRCRYDRGRGTLVAEQVPYQNGNPVLDQDERMRVMDSAYTNGNPVAMAPLREGKVVWEPLSPWNLLPQPGVEHERDLSWHIIVRPVPVEELKVSYPDVADRIKPESITSMDVLGTPREEKQGDSDELVEHALVYTGYERPGPKNPNGQSVVFTVDTLLGPPLANLPYGDKDGIVFFRWWPVAKRFWGRAFIEPGMEPQRNLNKRETQVDDIIDRGMPKIYLERRWARKMKIPKGLALEVVELPDGAAKPEIDGGLGPGTWMENDLTRLVDSVPDALGVKRVSLGENPPGVGNYSQYVAVKEQEAVKLGPISQRFNLGLAEVATYTVQAMKQWPDAKQLLVAGEGENSELEVMAWSKSKVPDKYLFQPAKRGSQPRGAGAELAKVSDLWTAAINAGAVARNPDKWLDWYQDSLEAGKAQPIPDSGLEQQTHKAALENLVMEQTGQAVPVAPYDNAELHIAEHDRAQSQLQQQLIVEQAPGAQQRLQVLIAVIDQHKQMHVQQAQQAAIGAGGGPQPAIGQGSPPAPAQPPATPPA
jgi:hypothetical protein